MIKSVRWTYQSQQNESCQSFRDQEVVSIRKANREERFQMRRKIASRGQAATNNIYLDDEFFRDGNMMIDARFTAELAQFLNSEYTEDMLPELYKWLNSDDIIEVHRGAIGLRKLLLKTSSFINEIDRLQIDDRLFELARVKQYPQLEYEIAWCFNILTFENSNQSKYIQMGIIEILLSWLNTGNIEVIQSAVWTINNIIFCSKEIKQKVLQQNYIDIIFSVLKRFSDNKRIVQIACSGIAAFFNGNQQDVIGQELIGNGIKILSSLIETDYIQNLQILSESIYAIFKHCSRLQSKEQQESIITREFLSTVIFKLTHKDLSFVYKLLKPIGNYIAQVEQASQIFFSLNILEYIDHCLSSEKLNIRRSACWIISSLVLDNFTQVFKFKNGRIVTRLLTMFVQDQISIKKQISFVLTNIMAFDLDSFEFEQYLVDYGIVESMMDFLSQEYDSLTINLLYIMKMMLHKSEKFNKQQIIIDEIKKNDKNLQMLESLQDHNSTKIYKLVSKILNYFDCYQIPYEKQNI